MTVYMKYSAKQDCILNFVVGRAGSEYGLPVAVISMFRLPRLALSIIIISHYHPDPKFEFL